MKPNYVLENTECKMLTFPDFVISALWQQTVFQLLSLFAANQ